MTDRELLEAAARAAGMTVLSEPWPREPNGWFWCEHGPRGSGLYHTGNNSARYWSGLTDDGDALRLFGRLPFCELYVSEIGCTVFLPRKPRGEGVNLKCDEYADEHGGDMQAAIRRAIVRAAAAMAKEQA